MEITEVRVKLMECDNRNGNERLQGFCSITFDNAFVVRDLKIIEGGKGAFVAMPSRRLTDRCPACGAKNHLRSRFCSSCGKQLSEDRASHDHDGRPKLHADIAHPINARCREMIQSAVLDEFEQEKQRARQPGYVPRYEDDDEGDFSEENNDTYATIISRLDSPDKNRKQDQVPRPPHDARSPENTHSASGTSVPDNEEHHPPQSFGAGIL